jgi:Cupin
VVHIRHARAAIGATTMAADPLSDLLKTVRLTGAVFFEIVAENPWAVGSPAREQILPKILAGADHLIAYQGIWSTGI